MQVLGIIFIASLAFAIAILILITCCFYKVNNSKEFVRDAEMCKSDTIHRMNQISNNKSVNKEMNEKPPNPQVILILHKKNKYADSRRNQYQTHNDNGGLGMGHLNDGFSSHDGAWGHHSNDHGYHDTGDCGHDGDGGDCGGGHD